VRRRFPVRCVIARGRVAEPGACADRAPGEPDWTLRLALDDVRVGRARLAEPLHLHRRCAPAEVQAWLEALPAGARIAARVEFEAGARMQARLHAFSPSARTGSATDAGQKNARTPKATPRPGNGA
jgi:hypothetical protein